MEFVNWRMMSHPINWFLVWLVLLFAFFGYTLVHEHLSQGAPIIPD